MDTSFKFLIFEKDGAVATLRLNRPEALNALCAELITELATALDQCEADDSIGCIILTGSEKAFAAGADIREMAAMTYKDVFLQDFITKGWEHVTTIRKPVIAAVSGYALGGGCELAMMCDFILASETAQFGQPEITIGTLPGAGGTQRLSRAIGKSKAMEMCLTGRMMGAEEAERSGLVAQIFPAEDFTQAVKQCAQKIAAQSRPVVMMTKEAVNHAFETGLHEGLRFERRQFHASFALEDRAEGMQAFCEKRKPTYKNQ